MSSALHRTCNEKWVGMHLWYSWNHEQQVLYLPNLSQQWRPAPSPQHQLPTQVITDSREQRIHSWVAAKDKADGGLLPQQSRRCYACVPSGPTLSLRSTRFYGNYMLQKLNVLHLWYNTIYATYIILEQTSYSSLYLCDRTFAKNTFHILEVCSTFCWRPWIFEIFASCSLTSSADASIIIGAPHIPGQSEPTNTWGELYRTWACQRVLSTGLQHNFCREIFPLTNFNRALHSLTKTNARSTSLENHRAKYWPEVTHLNATQANGLRPLRAQTKLPVASWLHDTLMSQQEQLHVFTSALPAPGNSEHHSNSKEWLVGGPSSNSTCARKGVRKESCCPCGCCCLQHDIHGAATFAIMPHWSNCCCYEHVECKTM